MTVPLVRATLLFDAAVSTATFIALTRAGKDEGKDALAALEYMDGQPGEFRLIIFGMMADGFSEVMRFIRWWDNEGYDPAEISVRIASLVTTLDWLFAKKNCVQFEKERPCEVENIEATALTCCPAPEK
eukprot:6319933-Pyramimonas_sp.AAC.1